MENIGRYLKNRRTELGMTLESVAEKVGVSKSTILRWETGDIKNMRRDKIASLSKALNISPSVIMGWNESEKSVAKESLFVAESKSIYGYSEYERAIIKAYRDSPEVRFAIDGAMAMYNSKQSTTA